MGIQTKIILTVSAIWFSIGMIALFIVLHFNLGNFLSGMILIGINTICHTFALLKRDTIQKLLRIFYS